uniref:Putative secreted peptide n=1 Tax=Anopheles braziliensis TaxID=58242 RepID=A0A2M3ZN28_9DIPT
MGSVPRAVGFVFGPWNPFTVCWLVPFPLWWWISPSRGSLPALTVLNMLSKFSFLISNDSICRPDRSCGRCSSSGSMFNTWLSFVEEAILKSSWFRVALISYRTSAKPSRSLLSSATVAVRSASD